MHLQSLSYVYNLIKLRINTTAYTWWGPQCKFTYAIVSEKNHSTDLGSICKNACAKGHDISF